MYLVESDQRAAQNKEGVLNVVAILIADGEAPKALEPRDGSFDEPAVPDELIAALQAPASDAREDVAAPAGAAAERVIISLVGMQLVRPATGPATRLPDRRDGVEHRLQHLTVVAVGRAQPASQRRALAVDHNVVFGARFAAVGRVGAGLRAPFLAGTAALARDVRLQSIWSAAPSRSNSLRWICSQTPARCQSRKRRQQVMPAPQPISCGNISQGMPLFSTNRMPVSAARLSTGGRPPFGFGRGGGNSGATTDHSLSQTRGFAIPWQTPLSQFC
jgi:hypothetical protein